MSLEVVTAIQQIQPGTSPPAWATIALAGAGVLTGLSAGVFAAFQAAVVPGLKSVGDDAYVATFQAINRSIQNPLFLTIFLGSPLLIGAATVAWWGEERSVAWWLAGAFVLQVINLAITIGGNIPLNEQLDRAGAIDGPAATKARTAFERPWNRLHVVRTSASVVSAIAIGLAVVSAIRQ